jgi:hypothetical protein
VYQRKTSSSDILHQENVISKNRVKIIWCRCRARSDKQQ